jgi:glycosyltransferase involved in cell wall biosynthesis
VDLPGAIHEVTGSASAVEFEIALSVRLREAASALLDEAPPPVDDDPARDSIVMLEILVRAVKSSPDRAKIWLLYTSVAAALPMPDELEDAARVIDLDSVDEIILWLLDRTHATDVPKDALMTLRLITDRVIVDVDHTAQHDLHTGIQQVVRRTLPIWARSYPIELVVWTESRRGLRELKEEEVERVLYWGNEPLNTDEVPGAANALIVPWRTVVVLPEIPPLSSSDRLATLARDSGNRVVVVGHDCIPAVSAELVAPAEPAKFARFLSIIKHARRVAGVSGSAAAEFRGFSNALAAQGLDGPTVLECPLPSSSVTTAQGPGVPPNSHRGDRRLGDPPVILCVGSFEPRKNQLALIHASERLWREGLHFELLLIAGSAWSAEVPEAIRELQDRGRPIESRAGAPDVEVIAAYRRARFSVFPSLHEGYGLPVAESLSLGTPVITGGYGATGEVGSYGGAVLIDPRDDEALVDAMRFLLTDDAALADLKSQIERRPVRSWDQYASDLWGELVEPELDAINLERSPAPPAA